MSRKNNPNHSLGPLVVTGAAGFVGANLVRAFHEKGYRVIGIDGPTSRHWRLRGLSSVPLARVDLTSKDEVAKFIHDTRPSVVINCAAYGGYSMQTAIDRTYRVNFEGVRNLLESVCGLAQLQAFIQAGTSSEYGFECAAPREGSSTIPDSHYAVSKVAATALVQYYARKHGVPACCLRLYSVYGPYEEFSRLIPRLLLAAKAGRLPPLVNPKVSRDFVYVDDVVRAFETVVRKRSRLGKGEIYNIGTGTATTLQKLVATSRRIFRVEESPKWGSMENRHWDHPRWYSNPAKARKELGWRATTGLEAGLRATMRWMDAHPEAILDGQRHSVIHDMEP